MLKLEVGLKVYFGGRKCGVKETQTDPFHIVVSIQILILQLSCHCKQIKYFKI